MDPEREPTPSPATEAPERASGVRFGLRSQLVALFTVAFSVVFAAVFYWAYTFMTARTTELLRADLNATLAGAAESVDADELVALYREGARDAEGFSADPRFARQLAVLEQVHRLEPRAFPYTFVRGGEADTRRAGAPAASPEFVYLVDVNAGHDRARAARFLEPDTGSAWAKEAWDRAVLVERPELYTDRFGAWMTSYAPIRDRRGRMVALMGVDFEASYVERVQHQIRRSVGAVFLGAYLVVLLLVYFAAGVFARPITELTRATEGLREGTLGSAIDLARRGDELGALARAYNRMSRRLARAFGDLETANTVLEDRVAARTADLAAEQEKSERLLRNVLPGEIAEKLKREPQAIAEGYEAVTVLFADIVGFTEMSARSTPLQVVRLLNDIFSSFDALAERHGLEKIKTIGDAYMVVGGLPTPRPDHAAAVADMALDMLAVVRDLQGAHAGLALRIGAHTGPVVAGVIGTTKFSYDLWGDTVNVASRMESHGERARVQVSAAMAEALDARFEVEERGLVKIKGRGEMKTFWLVGRRAVG
jgi:class 3 adenylate cyclase/HAMP domain-containing protein